MKNILSKLSLLIFALLMFSIFLTACGENETPPSIATSNPNMNTQNDFLPESPASNAIDEPEVDPEDIYNEALRLKQEGDDLHAMQLLMSIYDYKDAHSQYLDMLWDQRIAIGDGAFAVLDDHSVLCVTDLGYGSLAMKDELSSWENISAVSAHSYGVVGLTAEGTAIATKDYTQAKWYAGAEKVDGWDDLIQVSCGAYHTVGLKKDGTVVATKYIGDAEYNKGQYNVSGWSDIIAVAAGSKHTLGLKADGTVVACGDNSEHQCDVEDWTDIVQISTSSYISAGLKKDGTVVTTGNAIFKSSTLDLSSWDNIVSVSAGSAHAVGLKADGTVVAIGSNNNKECNVSSWENIRAVVADSSCTIGVTNDGTIIFIGNKSYNRDGINGYNLFTGEKGEPIVAPLTLPDSFPEDIPLYQNLGLVKVSDTRTNGTVVVFETSADFEDAFDYYERWCASRGGYLKQPYEGDLDMLATPMHDLEKVATIIVVKGFGYDDGTKSENCGVIITLLGGDSYESVANLK